MFLAKKNLILVTVLFLFLVPLFSLAEEKIEIHFFRTATCSHCIAENKFLDDVEDKYPGVDIFRYPLEEEENVGILKDFIRRHDAERYLGVVPLTFVGDDFFVGFDDVDGVGRKIENSIARQTEGTDKNEADKSETVYVPFFGNVDTGKFSLPALSVFLGFLDGFNVCSLSALVLILGLVLVLKSRKRILLFGGAYILTTTAVYGILIFLWYQFFSFFSAYVRILQLLVALISLVGSAYFFRQYKLFRKYGPSCDATTGGGIVSSFFKKIQKAFATQGGILFLLSSIFVFSLVITVVEFPCSAAIPVVFAGILANADLSFFPYLFYMLAFLLFYMLDEIIIFLIAVFKMNIWMTSSKFTVWATLTEAIILAIIGAYYIVGLVV